MNMMGQTAPESLLARVAMLSGTQAPKLKALPQSASGQKRTCIDGGGGTLFTLRPDEMPGFAVAHETLTGSNARRWSRHIFGSPQIGESLIFGRPSRRDNALVCEFLGRSILQDTRVKEMAAFGTIYMATRHEPETGHDWLSFALSPRQELRPVLSAIGRPDVAHLAKQQISRLLDRVGLIKPWSVAIALNSDAIRVGTTAWARQPETAEKSRNFVRHLCTFSNEPTRTTAIYSLLARRAAAVSQRTRVGVASEIEFKPGIPPTPFYTLRASPLEGQKIQKKLNRRINSCQTKLT